MSANTHAISTMKASQMSIKTFIGIIPTNDSSSGKKSAMGIATIAEVTSTGIITYLTLNSGVFIWPMPSALISNFTAVISVTSPFTTTLI